MTERTNCTASWCEYARCLAGIGHRARRWMARLSGVAGLAAAAALCASLLASPAAAAERYRVGPGDALAVSILGQSDLSGTYKVRENGNISLHILGEFDIAGKSVNEIEQMISTRATESLVGASSVIVEVAQFRDIFVLGEVERPGAYPYRPGMIVVQAVALAGGFRRATSDTSAHWRLVETQRRFLQARTDIEFDEAQITAVAAELARIERGEQADPVKSHDPEYVQADENLVSLRRALLERSIDKARRQSELASEEADSMAKRRELIDHQLEATDEQLARIEKLVKRGLARQESVLNLRIDADSFRADALEAAAFEARARQTAANADSTAEIARAEYRRDLLSDLISSKRKLASARVDYQTGLHYIQRTVGISTAAEVPDDFAPIFQLFRRDGDKVKKVSVEIDALLRPDDVLVIEMPLVAITGSGGSN